MRFDEDHESPDVIDRRGERPAGGGGGLGLLFTFLPILVRSPFGWVIILAVVGYSVFRGLFSGAGDAPRAHGGDGQSVASNDPDAPLVHFASFVLDDTQATWAKTFAARGEAYRHAKLVLFTDATQTACGYGESATGPFYCPSDERVYIDLGF
jgi:predicted metalloprotease